MLKSCISYTSICLLIDRTKFIAFKIQEIVLLSNILKLYSFIRLRVFLIIYFFNKVSKLAQTPKKTVHYKGYRG